LIINTKGGGHAFLGLHLAKELLSAGHSVSIFNDGDKAKSESKAPYSQYGDLESQGVSITWGDPIDPAALPEGPFHVVYDNNGKTLDVCKPAIDAFKGKVQHYVFVSSAGAYKANSVEPIHVEADERKASAGHVAVEKYLEEQDLPFTVFQPLYLYGEHTAKDCEQWFMDRILRDRPVPLPAPGIQLVSLTNVSDAASLLAAVPGNSAAIKQHFNLTSDRAITHEGIVKAIADAAGKDAKIVRYDPSKLEIPKGKGFPFRAVHFFASAEKAKSKLGWQPKHNFLKDVAGLVEAYKASGRLEKDIDFSTDDMILASVGK